MSESAIEARMRGLSLHGVRAMFAMRHSARDEYQRRNWVDTVRSNVECLRSLGPGPVEPVQSCGGAWTVTETWWNSRQVSR